MDIFSFADGVDVFKKLSPRMEATHVMEVAQLLLSLIHSWGIDLHLDKVCETQLGLLRPQVRKMKSDFKNFNSVTMQNGNFYLIRFFFAESKRNEKSKLLNEFSFEFFKK